jgi:HAD superfamily hydrolase (TIGR01490 family)
VRREAGGSGNLAVFDLDGTITRRDTLLPFLIQALGRRPWRTPRLALALPGALRFLLWRDRGAFKGALIHAVLGGLKRTTLERWAERFVPRVLQRGLYAEALQAISMHRQQGDRLLLMSASADLYVPRIARALGFEQSVCTKVRWRSDARLDGHLATANCYGAEKLRCLQALLALEPAGRIYAYGNSHSDLEHMQLAQQAYLVNGSARARRAAGPHIQAVYWSRRFTPERVA